MALASGALARVGRPGIAPAWTARVLGRRRDAWGVAILMAGTVLVVAAFAVDLTASHTTRGGLPAHPVSARHATSAKLPLAAQGPVSRILGQDDPSYRAVRTRAGILVRNPRQHLDALFAREGVLIRSGRASLGLSLRGYGYGRSLRAVAAVAPVARANRVEFRRGGVDEWYANGPLGLEQGFTLAARPRGRRGGPLTLSLALSGDVRGALSGGSGGVTFRGRGVSLAYRGLVASDARGNQLPARIELLGSALVLRIDDRGASYPLRIDPFVQQAKLTASDGGANDELGTSVAVSGDTVVVGAPFATVNGNAAQGAAYVFVKPAGGWASETEAAKLTASDGAARDQLGNSVAISGDTIVAGAFFATVNGNNNQGAAYVFVKPAGGWASETQTAKLTASDGAIDDMFGETVAISGDTVVAHSDAKVNGHPLQGAVYVFVKPASGWASGTETATLTSSDGAGDDDFGDSLAISGDTVAAGAPEAKVNGHSEEGAAYVFVKPSGGWASETETAKLTASDGVALGDFGRAVGISGDTVVVGADTVSQGAAYVFVKPSGGWASETETAKLTASDGVSGDDLGVSVAVSGDTVVAGAFPGANGNLVPGAAYVFVKPAAGWASETETAKLTASDGGASDSLGFSVSISGNTVVAGAPFATVNGNSMQGAAYVFTQPDSTRTAVACSPSTVVAGHSTTCTATVTDTAASAQTTPTGAVSFSSLPGPGAFSNPTCTLSGTGASANCQLTYTPAASTPVRTDTITATYSGDPSHSGSTGTTSVKVLSITLLARGSFVIGSENATVGSNVTFWGAQWSSLNSLSGGPAPASFKGFASHIPNNPPQCGDHWTSEPGNSSGPPDTVPQYMAVIASGSITQSGSTISGDAPKVVVVKTNPGYASNPGHAGTGTVVAIVC